LESDDDAIMTLNGHHGAEKADSTLPHQRDDKHKSGHKKSKKKKKVEKLVIGWGDAAWVVHVHPESAGKDGGERSVGSAEIINLYVIFGFTLPLTLTNPAAFGSTIVLFLAYRFIPLPYLLYLHIERATMTIIPSHRKRHSVASIGGLTVSHPNSN
jgi:hypothetical protein